MSEFGEDEPTTDQESGSALRQFGKEQKARADKLAKELEEIRAELDRRKAADIFTELEVPEKVRKFYQGEYTKDAIQSWMKENADVFGFAAEEPETQEQIEQKANLQAVQQAALTGQDRQTALSRDSMAQMRNDLLSRGKQTGVLDLEEVLTRMQVPNIPAQGPMM